MSAAANGTGSSNVAIVAAIRRGSSAGTSSVISISLRAATIVRGSSASTSIIIINSSDVAIWDR